MRPSSLAPGAAAGTLSNSAVQQSILVLVSVMVSMIALVGCFAAFSCYWRKARPPSNLEIRTGPPAALAFLDPAFLDEEPLDARRVRALPDIPGEEAEGGPFRLFTRHRRTQVAVAAYSEEGGIPMAEVYLQSQSDDLEVSSLTSEVAGEGVRMAGRRGRGGRGGRGGEGGGGAAPTVAAVALMQSS